ncbi:MAG: HAMP domain-containing sensor histidine kinase [Mariprofundus sp.]|nr:HAMP domain-containing sensor histidine kinase [Mariprofundus sp.]
MKSVNHESNHSLRRDIAEILSLFTHDASNPLINLESLIQYLQDQSNDLKVALRVNHKANISHLIDKGIPETISMMVDSQRQLCELNSALNLLYHCHCDDLQNEPLDMQALLSDLAKQHEAHGIIDISLNNVPPIHADRRAMELILGALISNAVNSYYHSKSDVKPSIYIHGEIKNNNLYLTTLDHGCGITHEEMNKIFTPFYKGIHSTPAAQGIGLSIVRSLLCRYHAFIDCNSKPDHGSKFTITWPLPSARGE